MLATTEKSPFDQVCCWTWVTAAKSGVSLISLLQSLPGSNCINLSTWRIEKLMQFDRNYRLSRVASPLSSPDADWGAHRWRRLPGAERRDPGDRAQGGRTGRPRVRRLPRRLARTAGARKPPARRARG